MDLSLFQLSQVYRIGKCVPAILTLAAPMLSAWNRDKQLNAFAHWITSVIHTAHVARSAFLMTTAREKKAASVINASILALERVPSTPSVGSRTTYPCVLVLQAIQAIHTGPADLFQSFVSLIYSNLK